MTAPRMADVFVMPLRVDGNHMIEASLGLAYYVGAGKAVAAARAINNHDALVEALADMIEWFGNPSRDEWPNNPTFVQAKTVDEKARAVLAAARSATCTS